VIQSKQHSKTHLDIITTVAMLRKSFNDGDNVLAAVYKHLQDHRKLVIDLVAVIERVEFAIKWRDGEIVSKTCHWCHFEIGHREDCKREVVLAKAKILLGAGIK